MFRILTGSHRMLQERLEPGCPQLVLSCLFNYFAFLDWIVYKILEKEQNEVVGLQGRAERGKGHWERRKEFGHVVVLEKSLGMCFIYFYIGQSGTFLRKGLQHFTHKKRYNAVAFIIWVSELSVFLMARLWKQVKLNAILITLMVQYYILDTVHCFLPHIYFPQHTTAFTLDNLPCRERNGSKL